MLGERHVGGRSALRRVLFLRVGSGLLSHLPAQARIPRESQHGIHQGLIILRRDLEAHRVR